jgi:hypothetical protein
MVSFRRSILALTVLALFAGLASAQIIGGGGSGSGIVACTMAASPNFIRAEGATELVGDIVISCTGGTLPAVGTVIPPATVTVNLSAPVTSRLLATNGSSEAVLLIDEPGNPQFATSPAANNPQVAVPATATNTYAVGTGTNGVGSFTEAECIAGSCTAGSFPNVFQGLVPLNGSSASTAVVFPNVPILAPGTVGTRIFRISNIRVSATSLPLSGFQSGQVQAFVSFTNTVLTLSPATVTVGSAQVGLSTSSGVFSGSVPGSQKAANIVSLNFLQCTSVGSATAPVPGTVLRYTSNFVGAFKTRTLANANATPPTNGLFFSNTSQNIPGVTPPYGTFSESGLIIGGLTGTSSTGQTVSAGLADFGTRLRAVFNNIPTGVNIYVSTSNVNFVNGNYTSLGGGNNNAPTSPTGSIANITPITNNALALLVMSQTVPNFLGGVQSPFSSVTVNGVALFQVPLTNGAGEVNYELVQGSIQQGQNLDFGVFYQYSLPISSTTGAATTPTVGLSYSPVPSSPTGGTTFPASGLTLPTSGPIPRFADTSSSHTSPILAIGLCQTVLLFPYVTNTAGFETGISIANTSSDTLGTAGQAGTCTLSFFSTNSIIGGAVTSFTAAPVTTASIPAGAIWANTLSAAMGQGAGAGTFQGYMFVTCNFQFAHGFAFISDAKATNLAEGYLALVVNDGGTVPARNTLVGGEALAQ